MTTKKFLTILALLVAVAVLSACRSSQVYEVYDSPIPNGRISDRGFEKAAIRAGANLGWSVQRKAPGLMVATVHIRDHMAQVDIRYNSRSYSIRYRTSSNLKYDAEKQTIHSNYNSWVQNLDNAIRAQLSVRD